MAKPRNNAKKTVKPDTPPAKPAAANDDLWQNLPLRSVPQEKPKKPVKPQPKPEQKKTAAPLPEPAQEPVTNDTVTVPQKEDAANEPHYKPETPAERQRRKKSLKRRVLETSIDIAGFNGVRRAWTKPDGSRFKNVSKSLGSKAADMLAGRIVSMTFRLIAITWVLGIIGGVTTYGMLALLAVATGVANVAYTFAKDVIGERLKNRKKKKKLSKVFNKARMLKLGGAFAAGFFGGGFGLWLAKTEIFQNAFHFLQDLLGPAGKSLPNPGDAYQIPNNDTANIVPKEITAPAAIGSKDLQREFLQSAQYSERVIEDAAAQAPKLPPPPDSHVMQLHNGRIDDMPVSPFLMMMSMRS
ncbi:MAG: hypothetical protein EP349_06925 [Alphaproteobacteria bacterium]|nr:MAG: hypothetical protein EP349_06925 [Alphaproteobacteria bacterium]